MISPSTSVFVQTTRTRNLSNMGIPLHSRSDETDGTRSAKGRLCADLDAFIRVGTIHWGLRQLFLSSAPLQTREEARHAPDLRLLGRARTGIGA